MDLKEALSHPSHKVARLLGMAEAWAAGPRPAVMPALEPRYQPKQAEPLAKKLGTDGVRALIAQYQAGTTQHRLAGSIALSSQA